MIPNVLEFTLLQMIAREASSGYELANRLRIMQNTHHSQIYPSLSKLEKAGFLVVHKHSQDKKPDKKVYTITQTGLDSLLEWSETPLKIPVTRDEFTTKVQLDWLNSTRTKGLIQERENYLKEQLVLIEETLDHFAKLFDLKTKQDKLKNMSYQVYARKFDLIQTELKWCEEIYKIL
ncbi:PadR family transcriptional regulator [Listeria cossartiae]|uniref:PadR family transcriptional regulator n=1 Tax=Listeria cossartiae TaxID=2838249 RepID=UPI0016294FC3|nr:PadR family transcriptional regulator [Listeria cossartiae]MBC1543890.1 PadR family transcriptional regulator [Listeria cossartiae subsp. cossartiae]